MYRGALCVYWKAPGRRTFGFSLRARVELFRCHENVLSKPYVILVVTHQQNKCLPMGRQRRSTYGRNSPMHIKTEEDWNRCSVASSFCCWTIGKIVYLLFQFDIFSFQFFLQINLPFFLPPLRHFLLCLFLEKNAVV